MIFALVVFLLVVIFFAFFIGKNLSNICNFWCFAAFTNVPVSVLVLLAFGAGIVFSIVVFICYKIKKIAYEDSVGNGKVKSSKERAEARKIAQAEKAAKAEKAKIEKAEKAAKAEKARLEKEAKLKEKNEKKELKNRENKVQEPVVKSSEPKPDADNK